MRSSSRSRAGDGTGAVSWSRSRPVLAASLRSSRAAQQIAGLVIALSAAVFAGLGLVASQVGEGWPLLGLGVALVLFDLVALEIARRVWQRGEVIGRV